MRIGILGTRGVPPRYGGFETFVAELGTRLARRGHEVTIYCRDVGVPPPPAE
ncbi:MAG TPA: glycosyltransferase, partial [Thermoanaerobaculia bacterium]|nr:glycosyltransferase [Thermoanaerobaculia bacterium]